MGFPEGEKIISFHTYTHANVFINLYCVNQYISSFSKHVKLNLRKTFKIKMFYQVELVADEFRKQEKIQ